jgi:hypothetical protein
VDYAQSDDVVVYYSGTIAVHVDLASHTVTRVVQLREEIHKLSDPPAMIRDGVLSDCDADTATAAIEIAETTPWAPNWEFGY